MILSVLAQTPDPGGSAGFIIQVAQYGVLGLIVIGFLVGWIWPKPSVDKLLADHSRLQVQVEELTRTYQAEVIPTLVRANDVLTRMAAVASRVNDK